MSDGRTHESGNLAGIVVGGVATYLARDYLGIDGCTGAAIGLIAGFFITPDIDHNWHTREEQRVGNIATTAAAIVHRVFWYPVGIVQNFTGKQKTVYMLTRELYLALIGRFLLNQCGGILYYLIASIFFIWGLWLLTQNKPIRSEEKIVSRATGRIVQLAWIGIWTPYEKIIPHRSPLSHIPGLGTGIRMIYILAPASILLYFLDVRLDLINSIWMVQWIFLCWSFQDTIHLILDL